MVEVNFLGVVLAMVASLGVGSVWYAKGVFGAAWMQLVNLDEERAKKEGPKAIAGMALLSLLLAYVLAHVTHMSSQVFGTSYFAAALSSAFWMWLGFVVPTLVGTGLFEQRDKKLMLINLGNWLVTFLVMGAVIGWVGL